MHLLAPCARLAILPGRGLRQHFGSAGCTGSAGFVMQIPFQKIRAGYDELAEELDDAYRRFVGSGQYVLGAEVAAFEEEYAAYCEVAHCVGVASGLDALHLSLRACGIGEGDEVIVASNTYIATWLGVTHSGAVPVPVEPDMSTYNLDPGRVEAAVTARTKAVLATNLYGQPCDYDALADIARARGLRFLVDNAQAQGSSYRGRRVGGIADIECHSFYPSKNLGAMGEAGAITTADAAVAERIRMFRNYGSKIRYYNELIGYNSRLDELQAAFLRVKLRHLDEWNRRRAGLASVYAAELAHVAKMVTLPIVPEWAVPAWHLYVVRHAQRDALQKHLGACGVETLIHYPVPPHRSDAYGRSAESEKLRMDLPLAERLAGEVLSLPIGPQFSRDEILHVARAIREFCAVSFHG